MSNSKVDIIMKENPIIIKLSLDQKEKLQLKLQEFYNELFYGIPLTEDYMSKVAFIFWRFFKCNGLGYLVNDISYREVFKDDTLIRSYLYDKENDVELSQREDYQELINRLAVDIYKHRWSKQEA